MELITSNIYLILYLTAWLVTFILYQKKKQIFDAGSFLIFLQLLWSIMSLVLFNGSVYTFNHLTLFPFIYLFMFNLLILWPIIKYDYKKINIIQKPDTILLNIISIIFITASCFYLSTTISDLSSSMTILFIDSIGGSTLYNDAREIGLTQNDGIISNLPAIISSAMSGIGILITVYYLTLKKSNKLILYGLILSVVINIIPSISSGQRNGIVETLLVFVVTYFALDKFILTKYKKRIKRYGSLMIIIMTIPFIAITNSRFGDVTGHTGLNSVYFYTGQENLHFNIYGLDNGGIRNGDRTFPLFKSMLGYRNVPQNFWDRRSKYSNLKINDAMFIGNVGDFTLDFGPFVAPFIFIFFTLFVLKKTRIRNGRIQLHQLVLLHFLMYACVIGGFKLYPFSDTAGNLKLIVYAIAYFIFKSNYIIKNIKYIHHEQ
jgi:oligosaccharide repeat unit polymerase